MNFDMAYLLLIVLSGINYISLETSAILGRARVFAGSWVYHHYCLD